MLYNTAAFKNDSYGCYGCFPSRLRSASLTAAWWCRRPGGTRRCRRWWPRPATLCCTSSATPRTTWPASTSPTRTSTRPSPSPSASLSQGSLNTGLQVVLRFYRGRETPSDRLNTLNMTVWNTPLCFNKPDGDGGRWWNEATVVSELVLHVMKM